MAEEPGRRLRGLVLSDFHPGNLTRILERDPTPPPLDVRAAPFGPVEALLRDPHAPAWTPRPDFVLVWTRPEAVSPSFARALAFERTEPEEACRDAEAFATSVAGAASRSGTLLVPLWTLPSDHRGYGPLDRDPGRGIAFLLDRMNRRLSRISREAPGAMVLDAPRWIRTVGAGAYDPKLWYLAKTPFSVPLLQLATAEIKAALDGVQGRARKIVILDLDDTLWGGIVGDVGWRNLRLGGHDPAGEAYADFQRALRSLTNRGILLGVVSKNEEDVALEAVRRHPEMVLTEDDLAGWEINWEDKAGNVARLLDRLNLGPEAAVFIDDSPVERERVRSALPEVLVPEWPRNPLLYPSFLRGLRCFDAPFLTAEDRERSQAYVSERKRTELRKESASLESWLRSLEIRVEVSPLSGENLARSAQLLNKTNQMNLATRRLPEAELRSWTEGGLLRAWTFRVSDRFGDSGLTGFASLEPAGAAVAVRDFVLSCRVMGRGVEETMVHCLSRRARRVGPGPLVFDYHPTGRNRPLLRFLERLSLDREGETRFVWRGAAPYPRPDHVLLRDPEEPRR